MLPNIAFIGKAGSGKSSAADLVEQLNDADYLRLSIAQPVKQTIATIWGNQAVEDRHKKQRLGEAVREIDPDAWLNLWLRRLGQEEGPFLNDDIRFENEYWAAKGHGFVIVRVVAHRHQRIARLRANGKIQSEDQLNDISETSLDHIEADHEVDNTHTKWELLNGILRVLEREQR